MGNYVWSDLNGNGLQDGGEPGVDGVTVELLDAGGSVISNTVTSGGGFYSFTNLDPGTYSVRFTAPDGTQLTSQDAGDDALDSDADPSTGETAQVTLAAGENNDSIDAGLVDTPVDPASLGNYVWSDLNGNGLQDGGEPGVDGVTVELLDAGGSVISNTVTAGGGFYSFTNLDPGTYSVRFTAPDGTQLTSQDAGDDALDSDADPTTGETAQVTLAAGENNDTIDAGLVDTPVDPATLGNYVWSDLNGNGLQDGGEPGVDGVTVELLDAGGSVISATVTAGGGFYSFTNLDPGTY